MIPYSAFLLGVGIIPAQDNIGTPSKASIGAGAKNKLLIKKNLPRTNRDKANGRLVTKTKRP
jgi:hypothetical protein